MPSLSPRRLAVVYAMAAVAVIAVLAIGWVVRVPPAVSTPTARLVADLLPAMKPVLRLGVTSLSELSNCGRYTFSPDGSLVAVWSREPRIGNEGLRFFDYPSGQPRADLRLHLPDLPEQANLCVQNLVFVTNDRITIHWYEFGKANSLALAASFHSFPDGKPLRLHRFASHPRGEFPWAAYSPDGRRLIETSDRIRLYDVERNLILANYARAEGKDWSMRRWNQARFGPDGRLFIVDGMIDMAAHDAETGRRLPLPRKLESDAAFISCDASHLIFRGNGRLVVISTADGRRRLLDARQTPGMDSGGGVLFSPVDGNRVLISGQGRLALWELGPQDRLIAWVQTLGRLTRGRNERIGWRGDGKAVVVSADGMRPLVWIPGQDLPPPIAGHEAGIQAIVPEPDRGTLLTISEESVIRWNLADGELQSYRHNDNTLNARTIRLDESGELVTPSGNGIRLLDPVTFAALRTFPLPKHHLLWELNSTGHQTREVASSADSLDSEIIRKTSVWTFDPEMQVYEFGRQSRPDTTALALHAPVAAAGWADGVRIWRATEAGQGETVFLPDAGRARQLYLSPGGSHLLVRTFWSWLWFQPWRSVQPLWRIDSELGNGVHPEPAAISPDCQWIAVGSRPTGPVLIETAGGSPVSRLDGHVSQVTAFAFLPDGRLVSAGEDGLAYVWSVPSAGTKPAE